MIKSDTEFGLPDPIDMAEAYALSRQHRFVRPREREIEISIDGSWRTYSPILEWDPDQMSLFVRCSFRLTVGEDRLNEILKALNLINSKSRTGALTLHAEKKSVSFRHGIPLSCTSGLTFDQVEEMIACSVDACERFYPAVMMVNRGGLDAERALSAAIPDTIGIA